MLLALPQHGYEVFSNGPLRNVVEEDLSELCKPFGNVVETKCSSIKPKYEPEKNENQETQEHKGEAIDDAGGRRRNGCRRLNVEEGRRKKVKERVKNYLKKVEESKRKGKELRMLLPAAIKVGQKEL
ncbi:hypothetical protein E3N88_31659 [Mikania micrantha]|uniref:Uncharacterized protein n=1 Tax=Mikania micrantha TaxID=192012 RepID=A0A5N6M6B6_9ASTR|nr:hypothetical protein E3N88_31659 [Mikania micrantha]